MKIKVKLNYPNTKFFFKNQDPRTLKFVMSWDLWEDWSRKVWAKLCANLAKKKMHTDLLNKALPWVSNQRFCGKMGIQSVKNGEAGGGGGYQNLYFIFSCIHFLFFILYFTLPVRDLCIMVLSISILISQCLLILPHTNKFFHVLLAGASICLTCSHILVPILKHPCFEIKGFWNNLLFQFRL